LNLLVFNLAMDADHSTLGHTTAWTNELARRCDHVDVITMLAGRLAVDDNVRVHSLGKEVGRSEPRRLLEFYRLVHRVTSERAIDACFAHMAPLFALLFAPIAKARRIPILLWYAHSVVPPALRLTHAVVDRCVTATPESFRLPSHKLFVIGHGIDTVRFAPPAATCPSYETTAVSVGRITPRKGVLEIVDSIAVLERERGLGVRLEVVGGPATVRDHEYLAALRHRVTALGIDHLISFRGPVPFTEMPAYYHRGLLSVNLSETAMDKAILESMASSCIPVSRNPAFAALARRQALDSLVPKPGADGLAACMADVLSRAPRDRAALVDRLRRIVVEEHSLGALGDRVVGHLSELSGAAARTSSRSIAS
jgi:glycosyltransferase involved in cell wall biosynthesis